MAAIGIVDADEPTSVLLNAACTTGHARADRVDGLDDMRVFTALDPAAPGSAPPGGWHHVSTFAAFG